MKQLTMIQLRAQLAKIFEPHQVGISNISQIAQNINHMALLKQTYQCLEDEYTHENLIDIRETGELYEDIINEAKALFFADKTHSLDYVLMTHLQMRVVMTHDTQRHYLDFDYQKFFGLEVLTADRRRKA